MSLSFAFLTGAKETTLSRLYDFSLNGRIAKKRFCFSKSHSFVEAFEVTEGHENIDVTMDETEGKRNDGNYSFCRRTISRAEKAS